MKNRTSNLLNTTIERALVIRDKNRPLQDLIFLYTILAMVLFTGLGAGINVIIESSPSITYSNYVILSVMIVFYLLARNAKLIKYVRWIFITVAGPTIVYVWILTEGSAGPSMIFIHGLISLLVFMLVGKELYVTVGLMILIAISCYGIEYFYPEIFHHYANDEQRTIDSLSVVILIFILEIPILIFARNALYMQRNKAIEESDIKTSIMANLSHEIRTPMNAIIGFADLMSEKGIDEADRENYLKIVKQNSRSLMNLLDNVISSAKLDSGTAKVFYAKSNANDIMQLSCDTLKSIAINSKIKLLTKPIEEKYAGIEVDENLLFQILLNLGYNAIKFTQEGSVSFALSKEDEYLQFSVSDTGAGIPEDKKENLFERFTQLNQEVNMIPTNGAGLGLSISKRLTELLQGEIWFTSQENEGSTFFIKIPIKPRK